MDAPVAQQPGAAIPARPDAHIEAFQFTGRGGEYFRIWIVNLLLTIVTLGIYSAWAKVRRLRYFYGNTSLAGSSFEYHGQPNQILKGRLIAALFLIPYFLVQYFLPPWDLLFFPLFLIALPFLVVKSRLFTSRMTSWRNIRFDFVGSYGRAAGVYIGLMLLTILTLGFLFPYWTYARQRFLISQTRFGETQFEFRARASDYYIAVLLASVIMGGAAFVGTIIATPFIADAAPGAQPGDFGVAMFLTIPVVMLGYLLGFAFMQARITNTAFSNTWVGEHKLDCRLEVLPLFWLYLSNALAALVSFGLLIPWAQVRLMRYQMERMSLHVVGNLDLFVGAQRSQVAAAGEELSDLLDVDLGL
ncbi:MAG: YjgN family protein [Steroidobacter sp.]